METFICHTLLRDKVVPSMESAGVVVEYRSLVEEKTIEDLLDALQMKAEEEIDELMQMSESTTDAIIAELADLNEVILTWIDAGGDLEYIKAYQKSMNKIMNDQKIRLEEVLTVQEREKNSKGKFVKGYFVAEVSLDSSNIWYPYVSNNYTRKA